MDLFVVRVQGGEAQGARSFAFGAEVGMALFGLDLEPEERAFGLLAVGGVGTRVRKINANLLKEAEAEVIVGLLDGFVAGLAGALARHERPQIHAFLTPGQTVAVKAGERAGAKAETVWLQTGGEEMPFAGRADIPLPAGPGFLPMPEGVWVQPEKDVALVGVDTASCLDNGGAWAGLAAFQTLFLRWMEHRVGQIEAEDRARLAAKVEMEAQVRQAALLGLGGILAANAPERPVEDVGDRIFTACRAVGHAAGIEFQMPPRWQRESRTSDQLRRICQASAVSYRQVVLRDAWWRADMGPLLCFAADEGGEAVEH